MMAQTKPHFNLFLALLVSTIHSIACGQITRHFEIYGLKTQADIRKFKSYGFDQVILDNHALLLDAKAMGLRTVQANWFGLHTPWKQVDERVAQALELLPSLVSINLMDEPIYNGSDKFPASYYLEVEKKIHQLHPTIELSLTEHGPSRKWKSTQLEEFGKYLGAIHQLRIDPYPVVSHESLSEVYYWIIRARKLMNTAQLPLTVILQTWVENSNVSEMPSIAQLRVMSFQAILSEVEVLSFFDFQLSVWKKIPNFEMDFANLIAELRLVSQRYKNCQLHQNMKPNGVFHTKFKCPKSSNQSVWVNTNSSPTEGLMPYEVRFSVPDIP